MTLSEPTSKGPVDSAVLVEASGVHVALGDTPVLRGISLRLEAGRSLALVGPNGAGKSTLLRTLAGLHRPARGEVRVAGQVLSPNNPAARRLIGLVGHQSMLYPELTARENLCFYGRLYGLDRLTERVERGLRRLDMARHADRPVSAMSRGMIQRLALCRALLHEPRLVLLDEPETGLDARAADALAAIVRERHREQTIILASHDLRRVLDLANAVAFLRAGRIVETLATADLSLAELQDRYAEALAHRPGRNRHADQDGQLVAPASQRV
jgi:heme ABC exporter ATP-binding subunit CcmA